eukprot:CAMPEP_0176105546 /NCGR_PEP_ID=MMETSP0120_2-20121206/52965_1 /TAXON_ID=160619 /ORGANISM="Kryptoperidinium foliaceum, Strain CCMP 1326" /LENGTH=204 /DNA_ID=CAMNT_0017439663 /DNA_START=89 /DNA_END=701 /DNA_ORIENTATION=-
MCALLVLYCGGVSLVAGDPHAPACDENYSCGVEEASDVASAIQFKGEIAQARSSAPPCIPKCEVCKETCAALHGAFPNHHHCEVYCERHFERIQRVMDDYCVHGVCKEQAAVLAQTFGLVEHADQAAPSAFSASFAQMLALASPRGTRLDPGGNRSRSHGTSTAQADSAIRSELRLAHAPSPQALARRPEGARPLRARWPRKTV